MKKGFTLIELLGVIAILGILATIAIPVVNYSISQNQDKLYNSQINQIIKGAEDYYATHLTELPQNDGDKKIKTITELQNAGNLELNIKNPKTNKTFKEETNDKASVIITKKNNNYKYCFSLDGENCEERNKWKKDLH